MIPPLEVPDGRIQQSSRRPEPEARVGRQGPRRSARRRTPRRKLRRNAVRRKLSQTMAAARCAFTARTAGFATPTPWLLVATRAVEDHGDLPEIDLRLSTQGMLLGNHHLHPIHPQPAASSSDIAAHRALCHLRTLFVDQTFPHPPGRVTLLARRRPIALQPAVDDRRPPIHHRRRTNRSLARHRPPMAGQTTADHRPRHQRFAINATLISSRSHNDNGKPGILKSRTVGGGYKHRSS